MEIIGGQLTDHFKITELACNGVIYIDPAACNFVFNVLEPFRKWYNRPININSGYRTPEKNRAVGGDPDSLHLWSRAIDFNLPSDWNRYANSRKSLFLLNVKNKWFQLCKKAGGYGQMTVHDGWIHLAMSMNREYYDDRRG